MKQQQQQQCFWFIVVAQSSLIWNVIIDELNYQDMEMINALMILR